MLRSDLMLMSLANHRYLLAQPRVKSLCAAGATADRLKGVCFGWEVVAGKWPRACPHPSSKPLLLPCHRRQKRLVFVYSEMTSQAL